MKKQGFSCANVGCLLAVAALAGVFWVGRGVLGLVDSAPSQPPGQADRAWVDDEPIRFMHREVRDVPDVGEVARVTIAIAVGEKAIPENEAAWMAYRRHAKKYDRVLVRMYQSGQKTDEEPYAIAYYEGGALKDMTYPEK